MDKNTFAVRSNDPLYNSPMMGNGEITTALGPTGYHNGFCPEDEKVNRTIFWAGRRLSDARSMNIHIPRVPPEELIGPTRPLIRLGRFSRTLTINSAQTNDSNWEQSIDYDRAVVLSSLFHDGMTEQTESRIILGANVMVFHTRLENTSSDPVDITFRLDFEFGDANGERPRGSRYYVRRPHPDDLSFGNVEGTRSLENDLESRPPHLLENLSVQYEIEGHIGEVRIGRYPLGKIQHTGYGGIFTHTIRLEASKTIDLWFWASISDRLKYTHFPATFEAVQELLVEHQRGWENFWQKGRVSLGEPELEAVYKAALYVLRCYASPFTVPAGYLSTHWEGRIFHDDFYTFLGLSASNHLDLAERTIRNRMVTIPVALRRGQGHGTYFGWEVTEDGEESAPYGHWTDEQFRHGQISEQTWRYYLYTRDLKDLKRFYPLLKGCAEWLIYDSVVFEEDGSIRTRLATDILEAVYPVKNSIYVTCATIKALRNAARAAELLGLDEGERETWRYLANELQKNLPVDEANNRYRYSDNAEAPLAYAHSGMVFPFAFDREGELARSTVDQSYQAFHARRDESGVIHEEQEQAVLTDNWMWEISGLASALFYLGQAEEGLEALKRVPLITGPFMTPCEHYRADGGPYLPFFGTGSGIYTAAVQSMFVQVLDEGGTVLMPALPGSIKEATFDQLLAAQMVSVSGKAYSGKLVELVVESSRDQSWQFRIPATAVDDNGWKPGLEVSDPDGKGFLTVDCSLKKGENHLI